jgi:hypothetical protein
MTGRIVLHLDPGLGWTLPVFVACCRDCGTELARHPNQATATRAASRTRCPACGTRTARRLPGTTSPATDLALSRGRPLEPARRPRPSEPRPQPAQGGMPPAAPARPRSRPARSSGRSMTMAHRPIWLIDMGDGTWSACCMACRIALYRGAKAGADRAARGHYCEPVIPLGRRRRSA